MRRSFDPDQARAASTMKMYEVFRDGVSTKRRFTSLPAANRYSTAVGGEVRPVG